MTCSSVRLSADREGFEWDQKEMPFTEHLRELRNRGSWSAVATVGDLRWGCSGPRSSSSAGSAHEYFPASSCTRSPGRRHRHEFKFSIYTAIVLGLPVLLYQAWMFIVPAIHPRTRRMVYSLRRRPRCCSRCSGSRSPFLRHAARRRGAARDHAIANADLRHRADAQLRPAAVPRVRAGLPDADGADHARADRA